MFGSLFAFFMLMLRTCPLEPDYPPFHIDY